jgi:hypothetical protein
MNIARFSKRIGPAALAHARAREQASALCGIAPRETINYSPKDRAARVLGWLDYRVIF